MLLIITPLRSECAFLSQALHEQGHVSTPLSIGRIESQHFPSLDITLARGGHGKTQYGLQTQHLLDHADDVVGVVCLGAAGALAEELCVGDLVVATETVEHDYLERFNPHPLPRFAGNTSLIASLQNLLIESLPFSLHFGIIASGDEDVIELERAAALRQATEASAVAWEGAGGARACRFSSVPFIEIRGITDTADHNASTHFDANLQSAMANAAELVAMWRTAMP